MFLRSAAIFSSAALVDRALAESAFYMAGTVTAARSSEISFRVFNRRFGNQWTTTIDVVELLVTLAAGHVT